MLFKTFIDESYVIAYGILLKKLRNTTLCKRDSLYQNRSKYTDTYQAHSQDEKPKVFVQINRSEKKLEKIGDSSLLGLEHISRYHVCNC